MKSLFLFFCVLTFGHSAFAITPDGPQYDKECRTIYTGAFEAKGIRECIKYFKENKLDESIFRECSRVSDSPGFYCYVAAVRYKASKQQIRECIKMTDSIDVPFCINLAGRHNLEPSRIKECIKRNKKGQDQIDCVEIL